MLTKEFDEDWLCRSEWLFRPVWKAMFGEKVALGVLHLAIELYTLWETAYFLRGNHGSPVRPNRYIGGQERIRW